MSLPPHVRLVACAWCGQIALDPIEVAEELVCLPCVELVLDVEEEGP